MIILGLFWGAVVWAAVAVNDGPLWASWGCGLVAFLVMARD
jgi:hypothetical protein